MAYNKYIKYKILKMKINQQLTNDEMILEKLPSGDSVVKLPRTPRKPFDERIAGIIKELVPVMISEALKPLVSTVNELKQVQQEQGKDIKNIYQILERNNLR